MAKSKRAPRLSEKKKRESVAKAESIAKAKKVAPELSVHIGSTPTTKFRGNPDVFGRLVEDHDRHRALIAMIYVRVATLEGGLGKSWRSTTS